MNWIPITLVAYLANAGVALTDKFLLRRLIPHPAVYAFFVSLMGGVVIVAAPFVLKNAPPAVFLGSLLSSFAFTGALFLFYSALKTSEASRLVPLVGSITPLFVFLLAVSFLGESLGTAQIIGFFVIVFGTLVLAEEGGRGRLAGKAIIMALGAALLFAIANVAIKYVYLIHPFASGLVWRGFGGVAAAALLFLIPVNRRRIIREIKDPEVETGKVFFLGQGFAAAGFFLLNYAFSLGPVSLVNALVGVEYAFLFILTLLFSRLAPHIAKEPFTPRVIAIKTVGIFLVGLGLAVLFL